MFPILWPKRKRIAATPPPVPQVTRTVTVGYDRIIFVSDEGAATVAYVKTTTMREYLL